MELMRYLPHSQLRSQAITTILFASSSRLYRCSDGSSWSSNHRDVVNGLHFRGRANFDAVIDQLDAIGGITTKATDVIFTGTSAGGVVMYEHANYFRSRMPASATVVAVPDAGMFLDADNMNGQPFYPQGIKAAAEMWNATYDGSDPDCLAHYGPGSDEAWRCFMGQYLYPYAKVPFFIINSQYDVSALTYSTRRRSQRVECETTECVSTRASM